MVVRLFWTFALITISLGVGCSRSTDHAPARSQAGPLVTASVLEADLRTLQSSSAQMEELVAELQRLAHSAPWRASGFFDARQQDQIEGLLFRFLACRHCLWHLANYHKDNDSRFRDTAARARSSAIAFNAGFRLILSDASLVNAFRGDMVAIDKLNEEFYRSSIPSHTYERLLIGVTNEEQLRALRNAFLLYLVDLEDSDSALARLVKQSTVYSDLVNSTKSTAQSADAIVQKLVETESRILPDLDNRLRHTMVAELLRNSEGEANDLLFAARAHLFKGVSRIKNPQAHLINFSAEQKRQVYEALEPGDIILTFTAGYISDIFIPGAFKHAITYVGSPRDRQGAGLSANRLTWLSNAERDGLLKSVAVATVRRAGHETLSADDIANNFVASPGKAFDFVLFAEEAPDSTEHQARILVGDVGTRRLVELMSGAGN